ncbi:MAG: DUF3445 domain-containing protein [Mesorhizobium sp.]|nr:DUF3445 domain-containing protein [Mesorhizobium sp.]
MTAYPTQTPYDGASRPFTIGLKPMDAGDWIAPCDCLLEMLGEKERLNRELPRQVHVEEPGTEASQRELLDLLADHLVSCQPDTYRRDGGAMVIAGGRRIDLANSDLSPLRTAASLVADDLVLMRRGEDGWRLAAASLCFPSSWTLSEKFGRPLQEIHDPVPGFGSGTRTADIINRIFDNLPPGQPVIRWNWSLQGDLTLYKPLSSTERDERAGAMPARFAGGAAGAFIRVERQTLRKLAVSGDIAFTIGIHLDPMNALALQPDGARVARLLAEQLEGLDSAQLAYKGLASDRDRLAADLRAIGRQPIAGNPVSSLL